MMKYAMDGFLSVRIVATFELHLVTVFPGLKRPESSNTSSSHTDYVVYNRADGKVTCVLPDHTEKTNFPNIGHSRPGGPAAACSQRLGPLRAENGCHLCSENLHDRQAPGGEGRICE